MPEGLWGILTRNNQLIKVQRGNLRSHNKLHWCLQILIIFCLSLYSKFGNCSKNSTREVVFIFCIFLLTDGHSLAILAKTSCWESSYFFSHITVEIFPSSNLCKDTFFCHMNCFTSKSILISYTQPYTTSFVFLFLLFPKDLNVLWFLNLFVYHTLHFISHLLTPWFYHG